MSRAGLTFLALIAVVAIFAQMLVPLITALATIGISWIGLMALARALKNVKDEPPLRRSLGPIGSVVTMNVVNLAPELETAEYQVICHIQTPGDNSDTVNRKYAYLIGLVKDGEAIPHYFMDLIPKRLLFEYQKKHGDLRQRYLKRNQLGVEEVLGPISEVERLPFTQFCLSQSGGQRS